jgi:nitrate reductase NapAB chaperone NapD
MGRRRPQPRALVNAAAQLCGLTRVETATAEGALVIVIRGDGVPVVAHNLQSRADLPAVLRSIAEGVELAMRDAN